MAKQRVYELARELGVESKEVLERAQRLGLEVKTASSGLDEDSVALVRLSYDDSNGSAPPEAPAAEADEPTAAAPESPGIQEEAAEQESAEQESVDEPTEGEAAEAGEVPGPPAEDQILTVEAGITVHEFARMIDTRTGDVVRELLSMGELVPGAGTIPVDAIERLGEHFGYGVLVEIPEEEVVEELGRSIVEFDDDPSSQVLRPAVVTVMGHVDHGKTQLLDTIRKTNVIEGEAGGITQHIGAYQVTRNGQVITFIDTPGHEAFTALRARGADVTDIVIIVVAADDGVMPQTIEAIDHARAADVPMIIAINKMDLDTADPFTIRGALTEQEIIVEELGGEVVAVEISALQNEGVDTLLDMISLVAEVEELKADPSAPAVGTVIEAQLEVGRGPVSTVIVQRGTLNRGDAIVAGPAAGKVRAMFDENGAQLTDAGPSTPVLVTGWDGVPSAGDMFQVVKNERTARKQAQERIAELRSSELIVPTGTERLGMLIEQLRTADHAELRVILKTDAHGSLEAIRDAVAKISREDGRISVIRGAVGGITADDTNLAEASDAVIYGFNTRPDTGARKASKELGIEIRTFNIIYELLDDVEALLVGELTPEEVETLLGVAEVRATFRAPRFGLVAGCFVSEGAIQRNAKARLVRDGVVVYDGRITSLRRFKDDVQTVQTGFECGIGLENFRDIKEGDTIESYEVREVART